MDTWKKFWSNRVGETLAHVVQSSGCPSIGSAQGGQDFEQNYLVEGVLPKTGGVG